MKNRGPCRGGEANLTIRGPQWSVWQKTERISTETGDKDAGELMRRREQVATRSSGGTEDIWSTTDNS